MELCPSRRHDGRAEFDTSTAEVPAAPAGLVGANLEHDLATLPAGRDSLERRPSLRQRKNRVDLGAKLACLHERSQLQQLLMVGLDDEVDRARRLLCDRDHARPAGTSPPRVSKTRSAGPLSTTAAPACRASWTAMCPTPPEAAVTSTRSPRASRPCTNSACQAVSPPIGRADASTWLRRKGFGDSTSAGTTAYSAATPSRSKGVSAYTSSPLPTTTPESS